MASCTPLPMSTTNLYHHHHPPPPVCRLKAATSINNATSICGSSSPVNLLRPFLLKRNFRSVRCYATSPNPEPPSKNNTPPSSGLVATFTRFQDTLQIFFAVLFWMSLFFWSCAWDGKNNGRPNKGSRFRK